jgi:hypothetical protein
VAHLAAIRGDRDSRSRRQSRLGTGSQVQSVVGRRKLWLATVINSVFPGLAVAFAFLFWNRSRPTYVSAYWVLYCGVTVVSAIIMWRVPYFLGASQKLTQMYST